MMTCASLTCGQRRRFARWRLMFIFIACGLVLPLLYTRLIWRQSEAKFKEWAPDSNQHVTSGHSGLSAMSVMKAMQSRQEMVRSVCSTLHHSSRKLQTKALFPSSPIISRAQNLLYCPAGKIASTFLTRFVIAMNSSDPVMSPFDIPIQEASRTRCEDLNSFQSEEERLSFVKNSLKIVFVRESYNRIFSAYVDKILSPNPDYWGMWGKRALQLSGVPTDQIGCGQSATFAQFVRLVSSLLHKSDPHVRSIANECSPCDVEYDIIGHIETLRDDVIIIMNALNLSASIINQVDFAAAVGEDAINDSTDSPFGWKTEILKCISSDEMGLRIWRKMQVRGIISYRIDYPFRGQDIREVTASEFKDALRQAQAKSLANREELSQQKWKAYLEAYKSVPLEDLSNLRTIYRFDLAAFGYSEEPSALFERDETNITNVFDVSKTWVL